MAVTTPFLFAVKVYIELPRSTNFGKGRKVFSKQALNRLDAFKFSLQAQDKL